MKFRLFKKETGEPVGEREFLSRAEVRRFTFIRNLDAEEVKEEEL